ncbi:MAG TPA: FAD-binding oxidoreductase [Fimbriimonadaceae bacterium]|nr:FAD-binding oxidoreductase [Fimbriimonadaceae bacterium]
MPDLTLAGADGTRTSVDLSVLNALSTAFSGEVLTPSSPGYDDARAIWNAMIDRRPSLIARCRTTADIVRAVQFAKSHRLLVAVRGGGHNIAGNATCDGGMVIDLSQMRTVEVDASGRTATAEPGVTLGMYDAATQAHGLATPLGINSTTGISGLTLGGGFGWLSRKYGLTIDNLISAEVVTAGGEVLTASANENSDLFWGIRGGGGNFGIVSKFTFRLHPVGPEICSGLIVHPLADAKRVMTFYRQFTETLPNDVTIWAVMRKAPPLPFLPEAWHGKEIIALACACAGDMASGEAALKPIRDFGSPIADVIGPHPYVGFQQAFDPLLTPGMRNYWKTNNFAELNDAVIDALIHSASNLPSPHCEVFIGQMGGATSRIPLESTAFPERTMKFVMNVHGRWETAGEDSACIAWARGLADATKPHATGNAYVNFMTAEEGGRVEEAYGASYARLVELKRKYDPTNLFRLNQNIKP